MASHFKSNSFRGSSLGGGRFATSERRKLTSTDSSNVCRSSRTRPNGAQRFATGSSKSAGRISPRSPHECYPNRLADTLFSLFRVLSRANVPVPTPRNTQMSEPARSLLDHLRAELHSPGLDYAEPLTPISGGYDTRIFAFRLTGASEPFSIPLILRILSNQYPPERAVTERATQNAVASLGYPAPRVLLASSDPTILGRAFLVMERLAGLPLLNVKWRGIASVLVELQLRLHALDADALLQALDREGQASSRVGAPPISRDAVTVDGQLARLEHRIDRGRLRGLEAAMAWLSNHRPTGEQRPVICHGDFHPQNILMMDGRVTGVIDWPNTIVADRALDVAATRVILGLVPMALLGVPPALRGLIEAARRVVAARYVRGYRRRHHLDVSRLAYYEALACMRGLVRTAEARLAPIGESGLNPLDASGFGERLGARFTRLTDVTLRLPPVQTDRRG